VITTIAPPFYIVEPEDLGTIWEHVRPALDCAISLARGEATADDFLAGLKAGRTKMILFPSETAEFGIIMQFVQFPRYKVARILLAFGRGMRDVGDAMIECEAWFKSQGCRAVDAWCATDSRVRLFKRFGYGKAYTIIRKELP
jgi:hypothetical protein